MRATLLCCRILRRESRSFSWCTSIGRLSTVSVRCRVTPSTAGPSFTAVRRIAASRSASRQSIKASRQSCRSSGQCADQCIGTPVRNAGDDQVLGWCGAGDLLAMRHVGPDQRCGQRAHADLVAAVADRDLLPPGRQEQPVQRRGEGADILATHIARRAIGTAPAAFDRDRMGHAESAPLRRCSIDCAARAARRPAEHRCPRNAARQVTRHGSSVATRHGTPIRRNAPASIAAPTGPSVSAAGGSPSGT